MDSVPEQKELPPDMNELQGVFPFQIPHCRHGIQRALLELTMKFQCELISLDSLLYPLIPLMRIMISQLPGLFQGNDEGEEMLVEISLQISHGYLTVL